MRVDLGEPCFQLLVGELPLERTNGGTIEGCRVWPWEGDESQP